MTTPQGGFSLGNAQGFVDIDPSGVRTGLNEARTQLNNFGQNMAQWVTNTGTQLRNFGAMWSIAMLPVAAAMRSGINAAADFDQTLTEIKVRAGLTDEAIAQVAEEAKRMGAETSFSTQQAADAFLQLMTAGLSLEQIMQKDAENASVLDRVLQGAAASGADLGMTADQVTNILASFRLEVTDAARIVDAMAQAAGASPASMTEMGEALQMAGGDATAFGLSLEQTAAALAIMANNGIRGSEAATQLRSMFTAMSAPTDRAAAAWTRAGTSLFDANGNARDFAVVLQELKDGLATMDAETRADTIQALAGSYGRVGLNALLASAGIDAMVETMEGQASAADIAKQMMETFKGQLDSLMGSLETLSITVMTPFMNNVLRPIVGVLISATNAVTTFASENEGLTQMIITLLAVMVGLGPVLTIVGQAMIFIGGALAIWLSPLGLIVGAIAAIAFIFRDRLMPAIQLGIQGFSSFTDLLGETNDYIGAFVGAVASFMSNFAISLGMPVDAALRMRQFIVGTFRGIQVLLTNFINDIRDFGIGDAILNIFGRGQGSGGESTLEGLFFRMGFSREKAIELTNNVFSTFSVWFVRIRSLFERVRNAIVPMFSEIFQFLSSPGNASGFLGTLINIYTTLWSLFSPLAVIRRLLDFFGIDLLAIFENVARTITVFFVRLNAGQNILTSFGTALWAITGNANISEFFFRLSDIVENRLIPAFNDLKNFITGLWDAFQTGGWTGVATFIQDNLITPIVDAIQNTDWNQVATDIFNGIGNALRTLWQGATWVYDNFIAPMVESVLTTIQETDWAQVGTDILNGIGTALSLAWQGATWVYDNLIKPMIDGALTTIQTTDWNQVGTDILEVIGTVLSTYAAYANWFYDNVLSPLVTNASAAIQSVDWSQLGSDILAGIGTYLSTVYDFYKWIFDNILMPIVNNAAAAIEGVDWFSVGENIVNGIGDALRATFDFIAWILNSIFTPIVQNTDAATGEVDWGAVGTSIMNGIGAAISTVFDFINWVTTHILQPLVAGAASAIQNYDWSSIGQNIMGALGNAVNSIGNLFGGNNPTPAPVAPVTGVNSAGRPNYPTVSVIRGSYASGIKFVPNDQVAQIHQGEAIIPAANNPYNPNASAPIGGGGDTFHVSVTISPYPGMPTSEAEGLGAAAGRGALSEFRKRGGRS